MQSRTLGISKELLLVVAFFAPSLFTRPVLVNADSWAPTEGEHFVILNKTEDQAGVAEVLEKAESNLRRILTQLDDMRSLRDWSGEKRIRVFLFENKAAYQS